MARHVAARLMTALALLVAGVASGWVAHRRLAHEPEESAAEMTEDQKVGAMRVKVVTQALERGALPILATAVGSIEADPSALRTISGRAGGRVLEVRARKGQIVARATCSSRSRRARSKPPCSSSAACSRPRPISARSSSSPVARA